MFSPPPPNTAETTPACSPYIWSRRNPTVPGSYWYKQVQPGEPDAPFNPARVVHVRRNPDNRLVVALRAAPQFLDGVAEAWWAGPLPEPVAEEG